MKRRLVAVNIALAVSIAIRLAIIYSVQDDCGDPKDNPGHGATMQKLRWEVNTSYPENDSPEKATYRETERLGSGLFNNNQPIDLVAGAALRCLGLCSPRGLARLVGLQEPQG